MSGAVISRETSEALARVMQFYGIDAYNRNHFGEIARSVGVEVFTQFVVAWDGVISVDSRRGINARIMDRIRREREVRNSGNYRSAINGRP